MLRHTQHKIATHHQSPDGRVFSWLSLITAIGNGIFFTIFPIILLDKLKNESIVGYYYSAIAIIILFACIYSTVLFQRYSRVLIAKVALIGTASVLFIMTLLEQVWSLAGFDIIRNISIITLGVALSIFIDDFTERKNLAKAEGKFYMFNNIGLFIGPVIGGYSAKYLGDSSIFILAGFFYIIAFFVFLYQHISQKNPHISHGKHEEGIRELFQNIKTFFRNKEFRKVFLLAFGLNYWWAVSLIYIPLEIKNLGFADNIVGWTVAAMALPLILFERNTGRVADKRGIRFPATLGFSLLVLFVLSFPLLYFKPILTLFAFGVVNFAAAWIEPLQETYFFKVAKKEEREKLYGIYNAAQPFSSIVSPFIGGFLYFLGGSKGLWFGTAAFLLLFVYNALRIKK